MRDKTCLLITPQRFYSFHKLIKNALEVKGYTVSVANDEYPIGMIGKIIGKLQLPIVFPITSYYINNFFLKGKQYEFALIIKGRGMSGKLINLIKLNADTVIGYNWDSFKYNEGPLKWYKDVTKYYTFDFEDANNYLLPTVELFSSLHPSLEPKKSNYDISAVFRNHSERLQYLDKVLSEIMASSLYIYIYEQNFYTLISNFVKNPRLYLKYWKYIKFEPLAHSKYLDVLRFSEFTIDYAHSDQSGITMRCYEAISMNTKIITNNKFVRDSKYFNDSNSVVFQLNGNYDAFVKAYLFCKMKAFNATYRNIHDFIDDLLIHR